MLQKLEIPPLWWAATLALIWALRGPLGWNGLGMAGQWVGGALILIGLALLVVAAGQMFIRRTTVIPRRQAAALVTGGVFRLSRNPIYLGDALILAGACLWWQVPVALILVPLFMGVIQTRFIKAEEAGLRAGFGAAYDAWAQKTRRWI